MYRFMAKATVASKLEGPLVMETPSPSKSFPPSFPSGLRVLIADGNKKNLLHLEKIVRGCAYVPISTTSINEAMKKLQAKNRNVDVVLIEARLAQLVAKREQWIRITRSIPVVLVTEKPERSEVLLAMRCGAVEVIQKPCDAYMIKKIWHHVARVKLEDDVKSKKASSGNQGSASDSGKLNSEDSSLTDKSADTSMPEFKLRSIQSIGRDLDTFDTLSADDVRELLPGALADTKAGNVMPCRRHINPPANQPIWTSVPAYGMAVPVQQREPLWNQIVTGVPAWGQTMGQPVVLGNACVEGGIRHGSYAGHCEVVSETTSRCVTIPKTEEEKKALRVQKGPLGLSLKKSESLLDLVRKSLK